MIGVGAIDNPRPGSSVYQHSFLVEGWAAGRNGIPWRQVTVCIDQGPIASTTICYRRPDIAAVRGPEYLNVGFSIRCKLPEAIRSAETVYLACDMLNADGTHEAIAGCEVAISAIDYRAHGFGGVLADGFDAVLARSQVYTSGPPAPSADAFSAELVRRYLRPGDRVLDVGCGIGAWAQALIPFGIEWNGCEARADFVAETQAAGLPTTLVHDLLPFADRSFDATLCHEVLEHVIDPAPFLAEVSRVSNRAGIFSVPNFAAVPIMSSRYAVPWHMLEGDHKWFFTVDSLAGLLKSYYPHVETFEYGELENITSSDGLPIFNHIMAVGLH